MLLVNKSQFFHYLFSLKIRLEIRFKNVLDRKETFLTIIQSLKIRILAKGLTHAFGQKYQFFHYLFSLKIRVEIRCNNVLDRKKTFSDCPKKNLKSQKSHFSTKNGLTHAFGEKMQFFSLFLFG